MGWLFCSPSRSALVNHLLSTPSSTVTIDDHSLVGNNLWVLYRRLSNPNDRFIVLCRLQGPARRYPHSDNRWGYKDIDEAMGPTEVNCPERLLAKSTCTSQYAVEWRERCREAARVHRAMRRVRYGDVVLRGTERLTVVDATPFHVKRSRIACRNARGEVLAYLKSRLIPLNYSGVNHVP